MTKNTENEVQLLNRCKDHKKAFLPRYMTLSQQSIIKSKRKGVAKRNLSKLSR